MVNGAPHCCPSIKYEFSQLWMASRCLIAFLLYFTLIFSMAQSTSFAGHDTRRWRRGVEFTCAHILTIALRKIALSQRRDFLRSERCSSFFDEALNVSGLKVQFANQNRSLIRSIVGRSTCRSIYGSALRTLQRCRQSDSSRLRCTTISKSQTV